MSKYLDSKQFMLYSLFVVLTCSLTFFSCNEENLFDNFGDPSISIQDEYGRTLIFHGLNTSSSAKGHPERQPWIIESDVEREATEFGFNFVRYLIFWDGVEPERGVYDEAYLDKVEERVNWYTSRGMYVMLDMHQDLYSIVFGGDGAPEWALETGGNPIDADIDGPWWLANINPAVIACWTNFWSYTQYQYLQDHYIAMWQKVAERFKDNPYVIGYDIMNEPWGGDLANAFLTRTFEQGPLSNFYERIIPAMRSVDPDAYLFLEPAPAPVTFGEKSTLRPLMDTRPDSRLVYAPHCYPFDTHEGAGYTEGSKVQLHNWENRRQYDVKKHGDIPLVCGEFGLTPNQDGFDEYLIDVLGVFDRNNWNWAYWSNDQGGWSPLDGNREETPILPYLIRTYPKATSGILHQFDFDWESREFTMYMTNQNTGQPTEIFIPERHYPNGWKLELEGPDNWTESFDESKQVLTLNIEDESAQVKVKIVPG